MKKMFILAVMILLSACTWVKLTPDGEKARVLGAAEVKSCKKKGQTTVSVKGDVAGIERNNEKIQQELEILARNAASDLGGDTVVAVGQPEQGRQVFEVYRCINP